MKWINIVINIFWGLLYSFITITFFMPNCETFTNWRWWIGGVVVIGIIAAVVSIHASQIHEMKSEIELLKFKLKEKDDTKFSCTDDSMS